MAIIDAAGDGHHKSPTDANAAPVEAPSGKGAGDENFPVGSFLLPPGLRPHVATFYAFARAIDDIADSPTLKPQDKIWRLEAFEAALLGQPGAPDVTTAERMRRSLDETGISPRHCLDLISAFKQDATKRRYRDWDELMDYCNRSAAPVGRYLLDLHGEATGGYPASDALCNALQVINHLQDCKDDYRALDRVYLPLDWLTSEGAAVEDLDDEAASPALRRVLTRALDGTAALLEGARPLPKALRSRRLAMESSAILAIADRLVARLQREDPLARRVALSRPAFLLCCLKGVWSSAI